MLICQVKSQSILINSKSLRLDVLIRIISSLNFREVDIKLYNPGQE